MAEPSLWEYRVETFGSFWSGPKDEDLEAELDEWGQEGWQVINIYRGGSSGEKVTVVAQRPLSTSTRRRRSWPEN